MISACSPFYLRLVLPQWKHSPLFLCGFHSLVLQQLLESVQDIGRHSIVQSLPQPVDRGNVREDPFAIEVESDSDEELGQLALTLFRDRRAGVEHEDADWIAELRGKGLMLAMETVHPGSLDPAPELATELSERCKKAGLLVGKGGLYGNVLRIAPPMTVTAEEIETGLSVMIDSIASMG